MAESSSTAVLDQQPFPVDPTPAPAQPNPISTSSPTLLTYLHALFDARQSQNLTLPYLQPFAPLSSRPLPRTNSSGNGGDRGKGKEKVKIDLDVIRELRESVASWRGVLIKENQEGGRLTTALKEVITHQSTLLPSSAALLPQASSSSKSLFPSSHLLSQPTILLQSIASAVSLQTFLEDSQFGLQQSSLAIAGERLVVDVDLGVDLGGEEDESRMGTPMGTPRPYTPLPGAIPTSALTQNSDERGKVKLLKLVASHVTPSGGTGQCEWIRKVLNELVNDYLTLWNAPVLDEGYTSEKSLWEREETARKLEREFADLKWFDDVAGDESVDWFEELEKITGTVEKLVTETSEQRLYPADKHSVFPAFRLLPSSSMGPNPIWRIRPAKSSNESVPTISSVHSTKSDGEAGDLDMEEQWLETDWVIECIEEDGIAGVVVSRNWLVDSEHEEKQQISGTVRLENLLYHPFQQPTFLTIPQQQPFPYTSPFIHSTKDGNGLDQHWSIAQPGPLGWVVGRVGMGRNLEGLYKTIKALRKQLVLNQMFASVFKSEALTTYENGNGDEGQGEDDDMDDDWFSGPPKAVPCSVTLHQNSISIAIPLLDHVGKCEQLDVIAKASDEGPGYTNVEYKGGKIDEAEGDRDLVSLVRKVLERRTRQS
ncbi:hypothetical protein CNAG_03402 [Cryptococcus neoformans var. grubii H99]|uniref:Mediator of RNA polymerase II transcription subunit 1 n=1 Tax=Cryptococcus neoformans (strain H99 / ATCC 208821 / CBS 10515 / FGSC 9487) TaxID=235443 RepID=J9VY37_CRYN9|nr:hypothetical protein CNAG_03402 [Cryptococcus neoformans var. grubii H99]AFR96625.1 hypothetical protein CNAG_03402 [Cryptococcus neoformans var. grubii H99]AUB26565.1 hypothetical protein CKF44_03402 [Cryptococcus neoformans var. grubii]|eukprot:XP_012051234.1 hypothetical protein CNAG_03402 [Cryptococcus neoformans var. grubii H99]